MDIENSVVLVTGANRGIGKAYVEAFLKAGAKKIYLGVRTLSSVDELVKTAPDKLVPIQLDVTNQDHINKATETATDTTILINNAGILFMNSILAPESVENARKEMDVNYLGPLALTRAFAPILKANGGGAIATVSSIAGHLSFPGLFTYSASKAATHNLIMGMRTELTDNNTQVIGVYPGPIDTDMGDNLDMDKSPASLVAEKTLQAITDGTQDVFPDEFAAELYKNIRKDPKEVEAQMLEMYRDGAKEQAA